MNTTIDFTVSENDIKCLFIASLSGVKGYTFEKFVSECKEGYLMYYNRNMNDLKYYGKPKTYSQWINGQILAIT